MIGIGYLGLELGGASTVFLVGTVPLASQFVRFISDYSTMETTQFSIVWTRSGKVEFPVVGRIGWVFRP